MHASHVALASEPDAQAASRPSSLQQVRWQGLRLEILAISAVVVALALPVIALRSQLGTVGPAVVILGAMLAATAITAVHVAVSASTGARLRAALRAAFAEVTNEPRGLAETAHESLTAITRSGMADAVVIAVIDPENDLLVPIGAEGYPPAWIAGAEPLAADDDLARGPSIGHGSERHSWVAPLHHGPDGGDSARWVATVPLEAGGDTIGMVLLASRDGKFVRDRDLLTDTAECLVSALQWAELYEVSYQREIELEEQHNRRSEFISATAHEIRTPLTSINAFAELLLIEGVTHGGRNELLASLQRGVDRLSGLINELLDLGRIEASNVEAHPTRVDLVEALHAAETLLRPSFELRDQTVMFDLPDDALHVLVDRQHLEQVLLNLLSNANRHTPERGSILIHAAEAANQRTRIEIDDSGPGIEEHERERIFQPYYRVRRSGETVPGSGLGLAVARRLTELQGGAIWVDSGRFGGAKFCVELPAAVPEQVAGASAS